MIEINGKDLLMLGCPFINNKLLINGQPNNKLLSRKLSHKVIWLESKQHSSGHIMVKMSIINERTMYRMTHSVI